MMQSGTSDEFGIDVEGTAPASHQQIRGTEPNVEHTNTRPSPLTCHEYLRRMASGLAMRRAEWALPPETRAVHRSSVRWYYAESVAPPVSQANQCSSAGRQNCPPRCQELGSATVLVSGSENPGRRCRRESRPIEHTYMLPVIFPTPS